MPLSLTDYPTRFHAAIRALERLQDSERYLAAFILARWPATKLVTKVILMSKSW